MKVGKYDTSSHAPFMKECKGARTAVLFVHGICGSPRQFDPFIPEVPDSFSVYNILLSGHGGDIGDFSRASMADWICDVKSMLDRLYRDYDELYLVGHSMGTLLLMSLYRDYSDKIKAMIFLASPLKMHMSPKMIPVTLRIAFDMYDVENPYHRAMRDSYSMKPDGRLWRYLGWIPRYIELFRVARKMRPVASELSVKTYVFQSRRDELVLNCSASYFESAPSAVLRVLENSRHFDYGEDDLLLLKESFYEIFRKEE